MALLVTSCTMGKHPKQLLDKGPDYLRTKTNSTLFAHHRKSAVELLEASKPQFVKSQSFENQFTDADNINSVPRSKTEYNLSEIIDGRCWRKTDIDELDGGIVKINRKSTSKPDMVYCCINSTQGRKINKSHRKYMNPDSSCCSSQQQIDNVAQFSSSSQNTIKEGHRVTISHPHLHYNVNNNNMSQEEEKMMVDNAMTLSTDMSLTQDIDMECRSGYVQRSHSDLSCQHSRGSPIMLDRNSIRFSRASADLEKFFNGMGIERNILDPMLRRQDNSTQKDGDIFESISSLDSPDTRSVCSGVSKLSEKTYSSTDCLERTLQSTSVVERNARIIKWLCNIKKAKQPIPNE